MKEKSIFLCKWVETTRKNKHEVTTTVCASTNDIKVSFFFFFFFFEKMENDNIVAQCPLMWLFVLCKIYLAQADSLGLP